MCTWGPPPRTAGTGQGTVPRWNRCSRLGVEAAGGWRDTWAVQCGWQCPSSWPPPASRPPRGSPAAPRSEPGPWPPGRCIKRFISPTSSYIHNFLQILFSHFSNMCYMPRPAPRTDHPFRLVIPTWEAAGVCQHSGEGIQLPGPHACHLKCNVHTTSLEYYANSIRTIILVTNTL